MAQLGNTIINGVLRVNGGIFASAFTGNLTGNVTGNASSATKLQTARTINGVSFDGSANITIADSTKLPLSGGTMTGTITSALSNSHIDGNKGTKVIINSTATATQYQTLYRKKSNAGVFTLNGWSDNMLLAYTADSVVSAGTNSISNGLQFFQDGSLRPWSNNAQSLGTSDKKWSNVYATTFTGNLSGNASTATSATKATQDSDGKAINTTYFKKAGGTISGAVIIDDTTSNYPFTVCGSGAEESVFSVDKSGNCYSHTRGTLCGSYDGSAINIQAMSSADFESKKASMVDGSIVAVW